MPGPTIELFGRDLRELQAFEDLNPAGLSGEEILALFSQEGAQGRRVIGHITTQRLSDLIFSLGVFVSLSVEDDPYDATTWNGSLVVPTKNAVRDKIEAVITAAAAAYQPIGSYQPLDSDLTAIAALSTTSFGRAFLALADAAATRTAIGLVLGTDIYSKSAIDSGFQPLDSDLTAIAALSTTSFGRALLALADASALRTAAGLILGTDIYSKSAIDSGFQPLDSDLTALAAIAPSNDDVVQRKAGAWTNRTIAQLLTDLGIAASYQPLDSDLTAIAALSTTSFGRSVLAAANAAALATLAGVGSGDSPTFAGITLAAAGVLLWTGRSRISSAADGDLLLTNAAGTGFGNLFFGGTTASFPKLIRSSTSLLVLLSDGSAYAPLGVANLAFPATQQASADANTLDDYEEGTWTPAVTFTTPGNSSFSYGSQVGTYTKIGRFVHGRISMVFTPTVGTGSGNFLISVPFTAAVAGGPDGQVTFLSSQFSWPASRTTVALDLVDTTHFVVIANGTAAAGTNFAASNLTSAAAHTIQAGFAYYV